MPTNHSKPINPSRKIRLSAIIHPAGSESTTELDYPSKKAILEIVASKKKVPLRVEHSGLDPTTGKAVQVGYIKDFYLDKQGRLCSDNIVITDPSTQIDFLANKYPGVSATFLHHGLYNKRTLAKDVTNRELGEISLTSDPYYPECQIQNYHIEERKKKRTIK